MFARCHYHPLEPRLARLDSRLIPLFLFALALLCYFNTFPGTFIQDDLQIVRNNPLVARLDLVRTFQAEYWQGLESSGLYRPLTILSLAINQLLFGHDAWGYHLVNMLLHAGVTVALWRMLRCWGLPMVPAVLAGLLFALHPLHTEVINQVVGRSELLVALFLLLALISAQGSERRAIVLTCGCYLAALLSKEHAVTFLVLLPLLDGFSLGWKSLWQRRATLYTALLLITISWLLWRHFGVIHEFPPTILSPEVVPLAFLPGIERFLSALLLQGFYLYKLLLPLGLQASYAPADLPGVVTNLLSLSALLACAGLSVTVALLVYGLRKGEPWALAILLYLASFLLTSNLFFPIGVTFAERLAYFPSLWFCTGLAILLTMPRTLKTLRGVWGVLIVLYLLFFAGMTLARNPDFSSEFRYWGAELKNNPRDYLALVNYAELLAADGRFAEAEAAYRQLSGMAPTFVYGYRSYTNFLLNQGRYDDARTSVTQALTLARERGDKTGMVYDLGDLARVHIERKEYAEALARLDESAALLGRDDFDLDLRGAALAGLGRYDEALQAYNRTKNLASSGNVSYYLALTLFNTGRPTESRAVLEGLVPQGRIEVEGWNLLGVVCAQLGDWTAANAAFEKAVQGAPGNGHYQENLQRARQNLQR